MGAAQFASPAAVDMLRSLRLPSRQPDTVHLAASDPANPYGGLLPWLAARTDHGMARAAGASVILVNGQLVAYFRRRNPALRVFLPEDEPERSQVARALSEKLAEVAAKRQSKRSGLLIGTIDDEPAGQHFLASLLEDNGFLLTASGFVIRRAVPSMFPVREDDDAEHDIAEPA